ncbi:MAG: hypothetical protein FWH32_06500 [Clostridiales bacterium]|nr:hypothetical protein [Clostridiales bacterium]
MQNKTQSSRKRTAIFVSALLVMALLVTTTLAYFGGQFATNVFQDTRTLPANGIGRDDYEPGASAKQVYVENQGETNLYARIKLEEFMELDGIVIVGAEGATREPSDGWLVHTDAPDPSGLGETVIEYGENPEPDKTAHDYWQWTLGGSKVYMPAPEGAGAVDQTYDGMAYCDTTEYTVDDMADDPALKQTPVGTVMTYDYWKDVLGGEAGPYWVINPDDGYIYWAQAIEPGGASGLLLNMVKGPEGLGDEWDDYYYAINVIFDFADTKDFDVIFDSAGDKGKEILEVAKEDAESPGELPVKTNEFLTPFDSSFPGPFLSAAVVFETESTGDPEFDIDFMGTGTLEQCYGYYPLSNFLDDTAGVTIHSISGLPEGGKGFIEVGPGIELNRLNGLDYSDEQCLIVGWLPGTSADLFSMVPGPDSATGTTRMDITVKFEQTVGGKIYISDDITIRLVFCGMYE